MKNSFFALTLVLFAAFGASAQKAEVFAPGGKAIKGYDPVAFFKQSKPVMGADSLSYTYKDVQWLFSTREDMDAFKENPEHFAPQYGGFCAFGTSAGRKFPTEVETWSIVNDKLYFNYNMKVKKDWTKDQQALIEKADKQWPELKGK
ncbi:MAG TPA: YHS domain-containing (seleno)protein [Patescibacteria group bacterium]